jgi:hypothetical protein
MSSRGSSLNLAIVSLQLVYHHHFTTRPLSSVSMLSTDPDFTSWKPIFYDRLRLHVLEADAEDNVSLPRPLRAEEGTSKQDYLRSLLTKEGFLLKSMADFASANRHHRSKTRRAIHFLHSLRFHFLNQADDNQEEALMGPRRTSLGGLTFHFLSDKSTRSFLAGVNSAFKRASMVEIDAFLSEIQSSPWAAEETFQRELKEHHVHVQRESGKEVQDSLLASDSLSGPERMTMVQRKLLREESSDAVKRSLLEWFSAVIR